MENTMFTFSEEERADMHFVHGFCKGEATAAVEYQRRFPRRRIPDRLVFCTVHKQIRRRGMFSSVSSPAERSVRRSADSQRNIHGMVLYKPRISTQRFLRMLLTENNTLYKLYSKFPFSVFPRLCSFISVTTVYNGRPTPQKIIRRN
jgi:hypothetical protein